MNPYAPQVARYFAVFSEGRPVAFYNEAVHGFKTKMVSRYVESADIREFPRVEWDEVPNPDCLIPTHAVPISDAEWASLVGANSE